MTLAGGLAVAEFVFKNPTFVGDARRAGRRSPTRSCSDGTSAWCSAHSRSRPVFGVFLVVVTLLIALGVANLRRSPTGRRYPDGPLQRAGGGVDRRRRGGGTKLVAFAVSSFIAGAAGCLIAYRFGSVSEASYGVIASLTALAIAYLGGITSVSGAVASGIVADIGCGVLRDDRGDRRTRQLAGVHRWCAADLHGDHQPRRHRRSDSCPGRRQAGCRRPPSTNRHQCSTQPAPVGVGTGRPAGAGGAAPSGPRPTGWVNRRARRRPACAAAPGSRRCPRA